MTTVRKVLVNNHFNNNIMESLIKKINEQIEAFKVNAEKRAKGNKAAGVRARKASIELTKLFKEFRSMSVK